MTVGQLLRIMANPDPETEVVLCIGPDEELYPAGHAGPGLCIFDSEAGEITLANGSDNKAAPACIIAG